MGTYRDIVVLAPLLLGAALVLGAVTVARPHGKRSMLWLALIGAVCVILWATLTSGPSGSTFRHINLVPFQEIRRGLNSHGGAPGVNLLGNVVLFVPVGALVAWLARRGRVLAATSVGLLLSVGIELTQLSLGRVADIDDVILNTAGAFVGGVLAVAWASAVGRRSAGYDEPAGL